MRVIGLTGGIASGKSTVSAMLRERGAHVIDADALARQVVEPGQPALAEIAARFPGSLGADGRLDRKALGERIFASDSERLALNEIIHPRIREAFSERTKELAASEAQLVVYEAPLLIENGLHQEVDGVLLVAVPREVQLSRLQARDGLRLEEAQARLKSQLSLEEKAAFATWVIDNSADIETTRREVERMWPSILGKG